MALRASVLHQCVRMCGPSTPALSVSRRLGTYVGRICRTVCTSLQVHLLSSALFKACKYALSPILPVLPAGFAFGIDIDLRTRERQYAST